MKYRSLSDALKTGFGMKVYRLALSSGCSCPNRDGRISLGGCTFCSEGGSGDFAAPFAPVQEQIRAAREKVDRKIPSSIPEEKRKYIAYFQSYTGTYCRSEEEFQRLKKLYTETIQLPEIVVLSIGTRPDCITPEILQMLKDLNQIKSVWVELGLQTIHEDTAARINRGYPLSVYEESYRALKKAGLTVITHIILGLPGETKQDMLETVSYVGELLQEYEKEKYENINTTDAGTASSDGTASCGDSFDGVKLQLLHVLRGTKLAQEYEEHPFPVFTLEEYAETVAQCLRLLPENTVIHRITGDGPKKLLIEPQWSADKKKVLNTLRKKIEETKR